MAWFYNLLKQSADLLETLGFWKPKAEGMFEMIPTPLALLPELCLFVYKTRKTRDL